jgi:pSer/pThr/pTyr-binding forkhead associated (FHA) protein
MGRQFLLQLELGDGPEREVVRESDHLTIGSGVSADFLLIDSQVSPVHCEISQEDGAFLLRDTGSEHGTWLGPIRVREVWLPAEARIRLGESELSFTVLSNETEADDPKRGTEAGDEPESELRARSGGASGTLAMPFKVAKSQLIERFEREYLAAVLTQHNGNITAAASAAQLDRVHFLRLLDRHGLRRSKNRTS